MVILITLNDSIEIDLLDQSATDELGSSLAKELISGCTIYLHGELGVGKTTLVRALLNALGHHGSCKSPTYTLVETYSLHGKQINHFDLYRLMDASELDFIGVRDYTQEEAVNIFEWADKGLGRIPSADVEITLVFKGTGRFATIVARSPRGCDIASCLKGK